VKPPNHKYILLTTQCFNTFCYFSERAAEYSQSNVQLVWRIQWDVSRRDGWWIKKKPFV